MARWPAKRAKNLNPDSLLNMSKTIRSMRALVSQLLTIGQTDCCWTRSI